MAAAAARLNLAVLKAHRLRDTSTLGKQTLYLTLRLGANSKTSDTHADAGTDCALGEVFNLEVPPGVTAAQLEVYAKHKLTGDDLIGTATIPLEAVQGSNGEVMRLPVMSRKMTMAGELEVTGSVAGYQPQPQGQQPAAYPANQQPLPQQQQPPQSQQQPQQSWGGAPPGYAPPAAPPGYQPPQGAYPPPQQQQPYAAPYPPPQQQQQGGWYPPPNQQQYAPGGYPPPAQGYPPPQQGGYYAPPQQPYYPQQPQQQQGYAAPPAAYPPPAGYPPPAAAPGAPQQPQQQQAAAAPAGRGGGGLMGTVLGAAGGAMGGSLLGGALSNAMHMGHHGHGHSSYGYGGGGGGWAGQPFYDNQPTTIINNYYDADNNSAVVVNEGDAIAYEEVPYAEEVGYEGGDDGGVADFGGDDGGGWD